MNFFFSGEISFFRRRREQINPKENENLELSTQIKIQNRCTMCCQFLYLAIGQKTVLGKIR